MPHTASAAAPRQKCPYLDTVNRAYLDFDFEKVGGSVGRVMIDKLHDRPAAYPIDPHLLTARQRVQVCSVSLTNMNVYCCLVCGKYFRGRGKSTEAHTHSVEAFHHVYMNLHNAKIYCLPGASVCLSLRLVYVKLTHKPLPIQTTTRWWTRRWTTSSARSSPPSPRRTLRASTPTRPSCGTSTACRICRVSPLFII